VSPASQLLPWTTNAVCLLLFCWALPASAANLIFHPATPPPLTPELDLDGSWAGDAANKGGSGWAPFNHQRDGKALLGQLDVAFLGAYACEWGVGKKGTLRLCADCATPTYPFLFAGCSACCCRPSRCFPPSIPCAPPPPPAVGMFISGHLGDRVDLRHFLTGECLALSAVAA
jgi:hypothetical protein